MKFRVMSEEFRNRLKSYDMEIDIVSGLVNLREIDAYRRNAKYWYISIRY